MNSLKLYSSGLGSTTVEPTLAASLSLCRTFLGPVRHPRVLIWINVGAEPSSSCVLMRYRVESLAARGADGWDALRMYWLSASQSLAWESEREGEEQVYPVLRDYGRVCVRL